MNADPAKMFPFFRATKPARNCAVPPQIRARARTGEPLMLRLLTFERPVTIVVIPKPIRPTTAGFAQSDAAGVLADDG